MSRLTIDISDQQHKSLKALSALEGKSIKQYALERLFPVNDELDEDWERFREFLNARIDQATAGNLSDRTFDEIVEAAFARNTGA
jgi:Antitoxin ParD